MTKNLVTPVTCKRCGGSGNVRCRAQHLGWPGLCFKCDGSGVVEGDPATLKALRAEAREAKAKRAEFEEAAKTAYPILRAWDREREGASRRGEHTGHAVDGLSALEVLEPERLLAAMRSVAAGHPAAAQALNDYFFASLDRLDAALRR